ncbi:MAG: L-rhamnonate dehydratase [Chloroflexi bacterium]|nr:L-rhamnonate dehydratase [Chloroflexota bacterium]
MRITEIRAHVAPPPARSWLNESLVATPMSIFPRFKARRSSWRGPGTQNVYVEVLTDEGLTGVGQCSGGVVAKAIVEHHLSPLLVGEDPRPVEQHWELMFRATLPYGRKGVAIMAISGVDLALWDLFAKWLGQPLYRALGGPLRDDLPVYGTHPVPAEMAREGYVAYKVPAAYGPADGKAGLDRNIERIAQARQDVGPNVDVMIDCWMSWDLPYSLAFAEAARPYGLRWIEEPLPPDDYEGYAELRRRVTWTQIATGEHEYTRWGFRELLERGCADVIQPDLAWGGGISEGRKIAALAAAHNVPVVPHAGGLQPWTVHFMLATQNCPLAEYVVFYGPNDVAPPPVLLGAPHPEMGRLRAPTRPGAGVELDLEELRRQSALAGQPDAGGTPSARQGS